MAYATIIRSYLTNLQREYNSAIRGGQHTDELSYRPVLDTLFHDLVRELAPEVSIDIVLEPRRQGRVGRPDWRFHDHVTLGIYGYVEAKGLSLLPFDTTPYQAQFDRYLTLGHKLVITDGIDFVFCMAQGATPEVVSLVDKSRLNEANWASIPANPQFELLMRQFLDSPAPQHCDEAKLVELVALRTRLLADDIWRCALISIDEALNDDERQTITLLSGLRNLVYNHNDVNLRTDKVFSDFTAQVIMFCLLYAHRVVCAGDDAPAQKEEKIRTYAFNDITREEKLLPFRNLMIYLRDNSEASIFITQWVDECIKFLSFVRMTDDQLLNPDYHKLFELFLSKFDAQARFDYGAYYTPKDLASYTVRLTERVVNSTFDGTSIFDDGNTIIDPCCGTGSFIEQIILNDPRNGAYNLCGIEILPAPYMLANYRLSVLERLYGAKRHKSNILLANTLSNCLFEDDANEDTIEGKELKRAKEISALPLKLIIGNPPSSDSLRQNSSAEFSTISELMSDFRPPVEARRSRQNIQKQINNPHMQFLRWSCAKLLNSPTHSVLSFVMPLSFLEAESYKYARKFLSENFSAAWVVAIDADARTGVRSDSLFNTLQGRAVIILTRRYGEEPGFLSYKFLDYSHLGKTEKLQKLQSDDAFEYFEEFTLDRGTYSFIPAKEFDRVSYEKYWPVSGEENQTAIFEQHCSGIKLAPTALFTHVKAPILKRRSKDIATGGTTVAHSWFAHQNRPPEDDKITAFQTALNNSGNLQTIDALLTRNIKAYSFRPYLTSNVLLWKDVLRDYSSVGGGGTRLRPEIIKAYDDPTTIGFAMAHAPKDLNPTLSQFVSFCWYYPDNDMCTRGNSHIYMNQYPVADSPGMQSNINTSLIEFYSDLLEVQEDAAARQLVFYSYAILCSQVFLDSFEGALFTVNQSDKRARIPLISDKEKFIAISTLGRELAELEKRDYTPENVLGFDYEQIIESLPQGFRLANNAHPFDEENEQLILSDGRNAPIRISCPTALQKLNISGYDVIKNVWLKFNSYDFTHCELTREDVRGLLNLLNTLTMHTRIVASIDEAVYPIIRGEVSLLQYRTN